MNVGPSDILQGIRILHWIWENGFVHENSRDVRYEHFKRDVQDFDAVLRDLADALSRAGERYRLRGASSAYNPLDPAFEQERRRLVGAFVQTLEECQGVLKRHSIAPQTNAQGILQSLRWAATVENKVNDLRRRLRFHSQKMLLVVNRLSLRLMTDSADKLDDILALSEQSIVLHDRTLAMLQENYTLLAAHIQGRIPVLTAPRLAEEPYVSAELARRFQAMLSNNAPSTFVQVGYDHRELPIDAAFDALMIHFTGSAGAATSSQTPEHYIQLLKALWLAQQLKSCQSYQNARPGFYYRRAINQIEQQLLVRLREPRLISFDIEMLSALSEETYQIWPTPEPVTTISQTDARPGEREEARLDLILQGDFTQQRIVIFRRSEHRFRIVQENIRDNNSRVEQQIPLSFDMTRDCFIPWYSLPQTSRSAHEVAISNQATGDLESYRFRSSGDLYRFQEIFLGQRMVFEDMNVTFRLSNGMHGTGRFQIWQEPVGSMASMNDQTHQTFSAGSTFSPSSPRSSGINSTAGSVAPSTIFEHAEGTEGGLIPTASLVILTEIRGRVTYLCIKLEQGLRIFRKHCDCRHGLAGYEKCRDLSLAKERLRKFPIYIKQADVDAQGQTIASSCDLSIFKLPLHPRLRDSRPRMVDNLLMTFSTPIAKDAFNLELHQRFQLRDVMIQQHNDYDYAMLHNAERPEQARVPAAPGRQGLSRTASLAPSVGSLQLGQSFADEVARGTDLALRRSGLLQLTDTTIEPRQWLTRASTGLPIRSASQQIRQIPIPQQSIAQWDSVTRSNRVSVASSGLRSLFRASRQ